MQKTTPSLNRGGIADLSLFRTLLAIHQKSREPSLWEVILCYFCTIFFCEMQVWQLQEPFETITSLSELYFRTRRFIFLVQTKKVICMNYETSASS